MARSDKHLEREEKYVAQLEELKKIAEERAKFLSSFNLPNWLVELIEEITGEGDSEEDEDSEGGGSGGSGNANIGTKYDDIINKAGKKYGINPYFIASIIKQESNFNPTAGSHAGARGLMQLMPGTASGLGVKDVTDPEDNVMGGTKYIKQMLEAEKWDPILALAAYNAGPGNVNKYGGVPPFKETQDYVKKIPANFKAYTGEALTKDNVRWNGDMASGSGSGAKGDAKKVIEYAEKWLKKSNKYVFGGGRSDKDIKAGRFDCSSWCRYIYEQAGYDIMNNGGSVWGNTDTVINNKKLTKVKSKDLQPGDLVFYHTYKTNGHITIYLGDGKSIGTQSSTGVAVIDHVNNSYWKSKLAGTHRRVIK